MVGFDIKISKDNTDQVERALKENMVTALKLLGQAAETNAVFEITVLGAVDTGNLRRSITHTDNGKDEAYVGTNVEYASYVEYGTSRMAPRPFLKQAIENHVDEYKAIIEMALKG